jgi:hypothetical protein
MATEVENVNVNNMALNESKVAATIAPTIGIAVNKSKPYFNHNPDAYASEMKECDQWLYSHLVPRPDGTFSKPPCNANGFDMDGTDPNNLTSFEIAFPKCEARLDRLSGLGFSIQASCPIKGIDMDHVFEGEWNQQAWEELKLLNTRVEWSPSHTGVHVFFKSDLLLETGNELQPDGTKCEMYFQKHFLTVTGEVLDGFPTTINEVDPELVMQLYKKWFPKKAGALINKDADVKPKSNPSNFEISEVPINDPNDPLQDLSIVRVYLPSSIDELYEKCKTAPCGFGDKFNKVMAGDYSGYETDESKADMGLVRMIAEHTPVYDEILSIIKMSDKVWDDKWERDDYIEKTIGKVVRQLWGDVNQYNKPVEVREEHESEESLESEPEESLESETGLPNHYRISGEGLFVKKYDAKTEQWHEELICHSPIKLTGSSQNIDNGEISYEVTYTDSLGHRHKSMYMQSELITALKLKQTPLANQINYIDTRVTDLCKYFNNYIKEHGRTLPNTATANTFGWRKEDKFIVGNKMITKNGITPIYLK